MTEEQVKQEMEKGFANVKPKVGDMTNILMDVYQEGFLTGLNIGVRIGLNK